MSSLHFQCGHCKQRFVADPRLAGKRIKCRCCGGPIWIPDPTDTNSVRVRCRQCAADFVAEADDLGSAVTCPACGVTSEAAGFVSRSDSSLEFFDDDLLADDTAPVGSNRLLGSPRRFGASGIPRLGDVLAHYWLSVILVLIAVASAVNCVPTQHELLGGVILFAGLALAALVVVYPPPLRTQDSDGAKPVLLLVGLMLAVLIAAGPVVRRFDLLGYVDAESMRPLLTTGLAVIIAVIAVVGFLLVASRLDRLRAAAGAYLLIAICLPVLWRGYGSEWVTGSTLPRLARAGEQDYQRFPELGPPAQIAAGVLFREVRLESPSDQQSGSHKLYIYTPRGEHRENSLPCIFISGGSSIPLTGTGLGPADEPEHIPYVSAGFVVIGYEVDGYLPDPDRATKQMILDAIKEYRASEAGLVNAEQAIEFALAKLPEVDANRLYTAGHGLAGLQSLLLAANDSRIKGCIAYAPVVNLAGQVAGELPFFRRAIDDFDELLDLASPKANEGSLRCPLFLFHARDDTVVPVGESEGLAERLRDAGKGSLVELAVVDQGDHYDPMISEGIPRGIEWLEKQAGSRRTLRDNTILPSDTPEVDQPDVDTIAKYTARKGSEDSAPAPPSDRVYDASRHRLNRIRELIDNPDNLSPEEVRNKIEELLREDDTPLGGQMSKPADKRMGDAQWDPVVSEAVLRDRFARKTDDQKGERRRNAADSDDRTGRRRRGNQAGSGDRPSDRDPSRRVAVGNLRSTPANPTARAMGGGSTQSADPFSDALPAGSSVAGSSAAVASTHVPAEQINDILKQLTAGSRLDRRDALKELVEMEPESTWSARQRSDIASELNKLALKKDVSTRNLAIRALGIWGDSGSVDVLIELLNDGNNRSFIKEVFIAIGRLKDPRAAKPVSEKLRHLLDRQQAESCLREIGSGSEDALIALLSSSDAEVRVCAINLLADVGTQKCLAALRQAEHTGNPVVLDAAATAIQKVTLRFLNK